MKLEMYIGSMVVNTFKNVIGVSGGGLLVSLLIIGYSILNFSGVLYELLNSNSILSDHDLVVAFYAPLFAISIAYLSVLIRRAACLYFAPNLKQRKSKKTTAEIILMVIIIFISSNQIFLYAPLASTHCVDALTILISVVVAGSGVFIRSLGKQFPFTKDVVQVVFSDWLPRQKYKCILPVNKYKFIVGCISNSYYFIACVIFSASLVFHT